LKVLAPGRCRFLVGLCFMVVARLRIGYVGMGCVTQISVHFVHKRSKP
jgi:hypothetical protein